MYMCLCIVYVLHTDMSCAKMKRFDSKVRLCEFLETMGKFFSVNLIGVKGISENDSYQTRFSVS